MELVPADGARLDEILSATFDIWHEGLSRGAYPQYYKTQLSTSWGRRHLRRWALVDGGEVLASAKEYEFEATLDDRSVRLVGLGAVFTQPRHRGHAYGRLVVERLLARAAAAGVDLALLFSEIGAPYYARVGFQPIPASLIDLRVEEDPQRGAPAALVRAGDERDLADLVAIGRARASGFRFHLNRDRDLIQYGIARKRLLAGLSAPGRRSVQFAVSEEGGAAVAYAVVATHGPMWTVEDAGDRDPSGARVGAILQTLIAANPAEPRPSISAWWPARLRPPQVTVTGERAAPDLMMILPLTPNGTPSPPLDPADVLFWHGDLF